MNVVERLFVVTAASCFLVLVGLALMSVGS